MMIFVHPVTILGPTMIILESPVILLGSFVNRIRDTLYKRPLDPFFYVQDLWASVGKFGNNLTGILMDLLIWILVLTMVYLFDGLTAS